MSPIDDVFWFSGYRKKREEREADVYGGGKGGATVGPPHVYNDDRLYAPTFAKNFTSKSSLWVAVGGF